MTSAYTDALRDHVDALRGAPQPLHVAIYHFVRNFTYGGAGQRDPHQVLSARRGTCSGKHILLRDLLRHAGFDAGVETVFIHFNKGMPECSDMSSELVEIIRDMEVPDYHHYVRLTLKDGVHILDATWPDALSTKGFPVNSDWTGTGNTRIAAKVLETFPVTEDVVALKTELLTHIAKDDLALRARFLELLSDWISGVEGNR